MSKIFTAYGLLISSEIELPELAVADGLSKRKIDLNIRYGSAEPESGTMLIQRGPFLWVKGQNFWLQVPGVAKFYVRDGREIEICPDSGTASNDVRLFLLGSVFGAVLMMRDYLVLHGNAVKIGDYCMICMGHSGAGKSTLAAGLLRRGYEVLADDIVPVDNSGMVIPGFPRIKLWQDAATEFGIETANYNRVRDGIEKFNIPFDAPTARPPVAARWLYSMNVQKNGPLALKEIKGMGKFGVLRNHSYRLRFLVETDDKKAHFKKCGQLASRVHLANISRPGSGFSVDAIIDMLLEHISRNPENE
jgi:hypothetical protein